MRIMSELGSTFSKTVVILCIVGCIAIYGIYLSQKIVNENEAERIINSVWEQASKERKRLDPEEVEFENDEDEISSEYEATRSEYSFFVLPGSTLNLIKIETGKKQISSGVCRALEVKLAEVHWRDVFEKVVIVDRQGNEKTNIMAYSCPHETVPALRFYVPFVTGEITEGDEEEKSEEDSDEQASEEEEYEMPALPPPVSAPISNSSAPVKRASFPTISSDTPKTTTSSCPFGTSLGGKGSLANNGCRCNNSGEKWDGNKCILSACPSGSSKNASGAKTNVAGCYCNPETPLWSGQRCVGKCPGNKILVDDKCLCPEGKYTKKGSPELCVECNETADCFSGSKCIENSCVLDKDAADCSWGVCQTCDENGVRKNILGRHGCETAGLQGLCNDNGTCYPTQGRRCSSVRGCPSGSFCNYGGVFNSTKGQKGKFGQTPNVCQLVNPQEFTYKQVTYYYNTEKDLKSWCRASSNKPNCMWGYLAKSGAESWCYSLGKRLLTKDEMADVWDVLKAQLPQTYTGYSYWVQEGVWMENKKGRRSFGKGHPDGYGGKGGVVCR